VDDTRCREEGEDYGRLRSDVRGYSWPSLVCLAVATVVVTLFTLPIKKVRISPLSIGTPSYRPTPVLCLCSLSWRTTIPLTQSVALV
jgi:hypothetical protein